MTCPKCDELLDALFFCRGRWIWHCPKHGNIYEHSGDEAWQEKAKEEINHYINTHDREDWWDYT